MFVREWCGNSASNEGITMALPETICPACGRATAEAQQCAHCGQPLEEAGWLEVGDRLEIELTPKALDISTDADEIHVELELTEIWETYENRRVFLAEPVDADLLADRSFVVEQESEPMQSDREVLPDRFDALVRQPLFRQASGDSVISVFDNDAGLALDELVEVAAGHLNLSQIRGIFLPLLDRVDELHGAGLLHLRLTPWTVRVRDAADPKGLPLEFLRETMELDEPFSAGLGDEDTFSEFDEAADTAPPDAPRRDRAATLEDLPSINRDEPEGLGEAADTSGSLFVADSEAVLEAEKHQLRVIFDSIEGFFSADDSFDEIPVIMGFSPPEMMGRRRVQVSEACDVFNLGMLLYFLVSGQLPPVSVYTRHVPAVPARNLRPSFPPGLQSVIGRATRPDPNERYPDVDALRKAFDRACDMMRRRAEQTPQDASRLHVAVDTHVGIAKGRRNPTNQDAVFGASSDDRRFSLVVVADGVSTASYGSGDLASSVLADEAAAAWEELLPSYLMEETIDVTGAIREILARANERIVGYVNENFLPFRGGAHEVMGTTALVAVIQDNQVTLGTLGDSRVYLHRGEAFEQLTIDHNLWTLSILEGVPADNALAMPHGDALARCLGNFIIDDERLRAVDPEPDIFEFPVTKGDTLLMTTDGLVDFAAANMLAAEDSIHQVLVSEPDPALACLELILLANRGGGGDNIGVGIIKFV